MRQTSILHPGIRIDTIIPVAIVNIVGIGVRRVVRVPTIFSAVVVGQVRAHTFSSIFVVRTTALVPAVSVKVTVLSIATVGGHVALSLKGECIVTVDNVIACLRSRHRRTRSIQRVSIDATGISRITQQTAVTVLTFATRIVFVTGSVAIR
jgi:hypothetical protein